MNIVLRRHFSRSCASPQVVFALFTPPDNFLGGDGVHSSAEGWQALATVILTLVSVSNLTDCCVCEVMMSRHDGVCHSDR